MDKSPIRIVFSPDTALASGSLILTFLGVKTVFHGRDIADRREMLK